MPELPEVEHAAGVVRPALKGRTVTEAKATATRVFRGGDRRAFASALRGQRFSRVERRGKWMLIELGDVAIASHLGMTGSWVKLEEDDAAPSHVRATLVLDDGSRLVYRDPRLFGRVALRSASELGLSRPTSGPSR